VADAWCMKQESESVFSKAMHSMLSIAAVKVGCGDIFQEKTNVYKLYCEQKTVK